MATNNPNKALAERLGIRDSDAEKMRTACYSWFMGQYLRRRYSHAVEDTARTDACADEQMEQTFLLRETLRMIDEALDLNRRRLDHAVKCLKRKGLYARDYDGLLKITERDGMGTAASVLDIVVTLFNGISLMQEPDGTELPDAAWDAGIELAMLTMEPDRMYSQDLYGTVIERNITPIYLFTVIVAYVKALEEQLAHARQQTATLNGLTDKYGSIQNAIAASIEFVLQQSEADKAAVAERDKTVAELKSLLEQERKTAQSKIKTIRGEQRPQEQKIKELTDENAVLRAQLNQLKASVSSLSTALDEKNRAISDLTARLPDTDGLPVLPETDVIFFGGHVNMVKKVMSLHPGWKFMDGTNPNFAPFSQPKILFVWDRHLSHPAWYRLRTVMPPDTPVCYLKSVNADRLESEMRRGYAAVVPEIPDAE